MSGYTIYTTTMLLYAPHKTIQLSPSRCFQLPYALKQIVSNQIKFNYLIIVMKLLITTVMWPCCLYNVVFIADSGMPFG